ncbi:sporadic carbohydrate cluster protein, LIC12192 family [bacterium]|mgnify:FL=1|nr:sporadic carbohydrate cluster protein, LIC12192 family [bacterium]|tara:strand:+ start:1316 stop:1723 length:408 start_codon:yes stop_codon:yes gene_type:complete
MNKVVRGYIFSRPFEGERAPQHIQNLVIRDFCKKNNLDYRLSVSEYIFKNTHLILSQVIDEINSLDGIVAYSMLQMPSDKVVRKKYLSKIINKKKTIYFALEDLKVSNNVEFDLFEEIWRINQLLPQCKMNISYG